MAMARISVDQDQFSCSICLDLLKNPVTVPCGHSYCMVCIKGCWDEADLRGNYSCPQCRMTFTPRPFLHKNSMLADLMEKLKMTEQQATVPDSGPIGVHCDFCSGTKQKAIKSCLMCLASFCETHIQPHYAVLGLKKHKLIKACTDLQEKICSLHDKPMEIYCRTDRRCICYLCTMTEHKRHDTVAITAERTKKQGELKEIQKKCQQRMQDKQKKVEEVRQAMITLKCNAEAAVEESDRIFSEMICSIEKMHCEASELIRNREKDELSRAEELLKQLEQEIVDLKARDFELEQFSHTDDHIQFLKNVESFSVSSGMDGSFSLYIYQHPSFEETMKSLTNLKEKLDEFCREELSKIFLCVSADGQIILPSQPETREDFLKYYCQLTLDPNTAHDRLILSENNRVVTFTGKDQLYANNAERFNCWSQVLCKESVSGRSYWEVERSNTSGISISVTYKRISRKGQGNDSGFGRNPQSWSLYCTSSLLFYHNNIKTEIPGSLSSRIGVYVDHGTGTLAFYSVSNTMTLLHRVKTTFNQPLRAGLGVFVGTVKLCDAK